MIFAPSSLILTNYFLPLNEALCEQEYKSSQGLKVNYKMKFSSRFILLAIMMQFIFSCVTNASELFYISENKCTSSYGASGAIDESGYVDIGGNKQWIAIRGENCSNPVVLFVHGGPGNPMSLFSESLYKEWEGKFTIVHWDQRGSGKTYEANQIAGEITSEILNASPLTLSLIVNDGLSVVDFIRKKLNKKNIIITGSSWGSVVAVKMISEKPSLFQFYVGLSQLVNYNENVLNGYENILKTTKNNEDRSAAEVLETIGSPPWRDPRSFGKMRKILRNHEATLSDDPIVLSAGEEYKSDKYNLAYSSGEDFSFIKFVGLAGDGMAQSIELDKTNFKFKIPIYIIQGEEDLLTSKAITERYFKSIKAPFKKMILVPRCGHDPTSGMLEAQLISLQEGANKY